MKKVKIFWLILATVATGMISCSKGGGINLFTIEQDKAFGDTVNLQISSNPGSYPLLDKTQYPAAYSYLEQIKQRILSTGKVEHASDFNWDIHIIKDDTTLNAFCTPGGNIYVYSGIIKFLDNEDEFAGVLAHEMAHAARRHSTKQMTKQYGIDLLLSILLGSNPSELAQITAQLAGTVTGLQFSQSDEYEADEYSVIYLGATNYYNPRALEDFFTKMTAEGNNSQSIYNLLPFLSTHPSDAKRVSNIESVWKANGSLTGTSHDNTNYQNFKNSLP